MPAETAPQPLRVSPWKRRWLTGGSLLGLLAGFICGILAFRELLPSLTEAVRSLEPVGTAWTNALRMTVTPLVVSQLVFTLVVSRRPGRAGQITGLSFIVFTAMLVAGGVITALTLPWLLGFIEFSPGALEAFKTATPGVAPPPSVQSSPGSWLTGLVPNNVLRAAVQDELIGVILFAVAFGIAVSRMGDEPRALISSLARVVAEAMMTIVHWLLWLMPVAVFLLAFGTARRSGFAALEVTVAFVVLTCSALVVLTLLLYPAAAVLGGVSILRFARAALPVQLVALGTRSSIAALPSLVEAAEHKLKLHQDVSRLVVPFAVSTFKLNRTTTTMIQFMFLAHVTGVDLSFLQIAGFMVASVLLSYTTLGIPSGGSLMRSAPFYVAAGIPIEAYLLMEAVEVIPDLFKTLVNVTGDLAAATIVNRRVEAAGAVGSAAPLPSAT